MVELAFEVVGSSLEGHFGVVSEQKLYKASITVFNRMMRCTCGKVCGTQVGFTKHKKACDARVVQNVIKCDVCGKSCSTRSGLSNHKKFCESFKCGVCGIFIARKRDLDNHKKNCRIVVDNVVENVVEDENLVENEDIVNISIEDSPLEMIIRGGSNNGKIIRKTNENPQRVALYDIISIVSETDQANVMLYRLKMLYPQVVFLCNNVYKFKGKGQKPTPVVDARGFVTIVNLLPGLKAAEFRAKSADIIVRFLGGDLTLIEEIKRNAEMQANLPSDHPLAFFGQDVASTSATPITYYLNLQKSPIEFNYDLGIHSDLLAPNCIYCIFIGYDSIKKIYIFKYGMTTDIKTRIAEHRMTYKNMKIIFIISLGEYDVRTGEDTIKYCHHVRSRIIDLVMDESKKKECFACDFGDIKEVMNGIIGDVKKQHGPKIKLIHSVFSDEVRMQEEGIEIYDHISHYHNNNPKSVPLNIPLNFSSLEIEKEKTLQEKEKTLQEKEKTLQLELTLEKLKLEIKLVEVRGRYNQYI